MNVSIITISYNTRDITLACLRSIFAQTSGLQFEVIVVDNASSDESAQAIAEQFPQVKLVASEQNLGFARGNNVAARHASGQWLLLLNPDTVVLDGAIQTIVRFAEDHPQAGIFGGRAFFGDGSLNYNSCHGLPTPWSVFCKGVGLSAVFRRSRWFDRESLGGWRRNTAREVEAVTGCFLLIRRSLWEHLGGFDETFFMYMEETDLCLRAWQAGSRCMICPDARIVHHVGKSSTNEADKMVRLFRSRAQLFRKHWSPIAAWFGVRMLDLWTLNRLLLLGVLRWIKPSREAPYHALRSIWRRRDEFHSAAASQAAQKSPGI